MAHRKKPRRKPRLDLGYPPQPCGLPYEKFRSGWTYRDAYMNLVYRKDASGRTFAPSNKRVVQHLGKLKRQEYERYQSECRSPEFEREGTYAEEGDVSFDPATMPEEALLFGLRGRRRR